MLHLPSICTIRPLDRELREIALARMPVYVDRALRKSGREPKVVYQVRGIASSAARDRAGDTIADGALDWRPLLRSGFINDDHGEDADRLIGFPTEIWRTSVTDDAGVSHPATGVAGCLVDMPRAHNYFRLSKSMGDARPLGFSVEGPPVIRDRADPSRIIRGTVCHLALTPWPINTTCRADLSLAKSMRKALALSDIASLVPEDLSDGLDLNAVLARVRKSYPGLTMQQLERVLARRKS